MRKRENQAKAFSPLRGGGDIIAGQQALSATRLSAMSLRMERAYIVIYLK